MEFGVKITARDGRPIGLSRATMRFLGYIGSAAALSIGFLMIAWDRNKQGLHDKIAGTVAVIEPRPECAEAPAGMDEIEREYHGL